LIEGRINIAAADDLLSRRLRCHLKKINIKDTGYKCLYNGCASTSVCLQYFDYVMRVLLPEILIKIVMHLRRIDHDAAELFMFNEFQANSVP
jgi:hypothetical protein